jgi:hypothetical protein
VLEIIVQPGIHFFREIDSFLNNRANVSSFYRNIPDIVYPAGTHILVSSSVMEDSISFQHNNGNLTKSITYNLPRRCLFLRLLFFVVHFVTMWFENFHSDWLMTGGVQVEMAKSC